MMNMATSTENIENEIRTVIAEILEVDESKIEKDTNFNDDLGMDSMMALEILASIEKKYRIKISEEYLTKVTSLSNIVDIVRTIIGTK
jgi:acyl carrier protein